VLLTTLAWRRLLLALCAFAFLQLGITVGVQAWKFAVIPGLQSNGGLPGESASEDATAIPFVRRLTFPPSSPLEKAGLRSGDLVDLRGAQPAIRYRFTMRWWWLGERADVRVIHDGIPRTIALTPTWYVFPIDWTIANIGLAWMLVFAGVVAWRRSDLPQARVLAMLLILYEIGLTFQEQNWVTPWPPLDAALNALSGFFYFGGLSLLATYAISFARPAVTARRLLAGLSYAFAAVAGTMVFLRIAGIWTLTLDPRGAWFTGSVGQLFMGVLPYVTPLACVALTLPALRGVERNRFIWAVTPLAIIYVVGICFTITQIFNADAITPRWLGYSDNIALFLAPLGLTYSLLNRRLLDLGFAINRAAVFSGVSIIIVAVFVLAEWILSEWFSNASHTTNLAVNAGLALSLGLSVRGIHHRVDRVLNSLFFRKRHDDEKALQTFAHEAAYITDARVLLDRAKQTLVEHADASSVTFLLNDGEGQYGIVSENDAAIVALRAWRKVLDLHAVRTELQGEFAYPMIARGRLVGALVLGPKRSGESYAPDETEAILKLAHGVGGALDVLSLEGDGARDHILAAIAALSDQMRDLRETLTRDVRAAPK